MVIDFSESESEKKNSGKVYIQINLKRWGKFILFNW